jgi:hypothetical protein
VYAACCQDRPNFFSQPSPYRINLQVSHLHYTPSFLPPFPVTFEWSNVNGTSDHPTPEGSAGGPSTEVALRRTRRKSRLRHPSSRLKKVSSFNLMLVVPLILPSPAFPPPRPPNKHPMFRLPAQTPYPNAPPPLLPDPQLPSFPDGLLQTY